MATLELWLERPGPGPRGRCVTVKLQRPWAGVQIHERKACSAWPSSLEKKGAEVKLVAFQ